MLLHSAQGWKRREDYGVFLADRERPDPSDADDILDDFLTSSSVHGHDTWLEDYDEAPPEG